MSSLYDEVKRGIKLQSLIRDEFSKVDPDYEKRRFDEDGNLIYGPMPSVMSSGSGYLCDLIGCGDRYAEFEAALHRALVRAGQGS